MDHDQLAVQLCTQLYGRIRIEPRSVAVGLAQCPHDGRDAGAPSESTPPPRRIGPAPGGRGLQLSQCRPTKNPWCSHLGRGRRRRRRVSGPEWRWPSSRCRRRRRRVTADCGRATMLKRAKEKAEQVKAQALEKAEQIKTERAARRNSLEGHPPHPLHRIIHDRSYGCGARRYTLTAPCHAPSKVESWMPRSSQRWSRWLHCRSPTRRFWRISHPSSAARSSIRNLTL